jgi:hypothetical protein
MPALLQATLQSDPGPELGELLGTAREGTPLRAALLPLAEEFAKRPEKS